MEKKMEDIFIEWSLKSLFSLIKEGIKDIFEIDKGNNFENFLTEVGEHTLDAFEESIDAVKESEEFKQLNESNKKKKKESDKDNKNK